MSADQIKFRASSIGKLMTEPRSGKGLSETTKKYLVEVFVNEKYGREKDIENKYITKGLMCEEDSLTLYSRHKQFFYTKNQETIENEFIKGTPDIILYDKTHEVYEAATVVDVKSSWNIFTFFSQSPDALNKDYYWQIQSYCALTGAKSGLLAYCLIDTPEILIGDEKRKLLYKMGVATEDNETYAEACDEIDRLSRYSDIPMRDKVIEIPIERNDTDIERIYQRVKDCREYMNMNLFKLESQLKQTTS